MALAQANEMSDFGSFCDEASDSDVSGEAADEEVEEKKEGQVESKDLDLAHEGGSNANDGEVDDEDDDEGFEDDDGDQDEQLMPVLKVNRHETIKQEEQDEEANLENFDKFDYRNVDLNKLSDEELKAHKQAMEVKFKQNAVKKGDPGF